MWWYSQTTGALWRNNDATLAHGYAGAGEGINNAMMQHVRNVGPLPRGLYQMAQAVTHRRLGPLAIRLLPDPHNDMMDRSDFWIHGDNRHRNRTGSEGCPVLDRPARMVLAGSPDRWLVVVA